MFKRLGRSTPSPGVDPASLLPPVAPSTHPGYSPPLSSSPRQSGEPLRPASPIANGSYQDGTGVSGTYGSVDRVTLQKSLRALEGLLVELNEYRDVNVRLAKCEKRLAKAAKEVAGAFEGNTSKAPQSPGGREMLEVAEVIAASLSATATFYDALAEVDTKFAKSLQKDYDEANDACAKAFKRIAKEEKSHDDSLSSLDTKLKKASMAYDKTRTANSVPDPASQSKYLTLLNTLSSEMSLAKQRHAALMGLRRTEVVVEVARVLGGVGESEWRRTCEGIRKGGKEIGGVVEWTTYCGLGVGKMSGIVASDFSEKDREREGRDEKKEKESTVTFADPPSSRRDSTIRPLPSQPKSPPLPSAIKQNTMTSPTPEPSPSLSTQTQPQKSTTPTSPSERPQAGNQKPVANQADSAPLATVAEEKTTSWGSPREGRTYGSTTSPPQPQPSSQRTSGQFSPRLPSNPDIPNLLQKPDQDRPLPLSSSPKMVDDGQLPPQYSPGMMKFPLREKEGFADSNNASTSGSGSNTSSNIVPPTPRDEDGRPRFEKGEIDSLLRKGFTMEEIEEGDDRQSLVSPILGKNKFWSDLPNPAPPIQHQQRIPPHQHQQQQRPLPPPQPQPQPDRRMSTYEGDLPPMPMPQPIPQTSRRHTMDPYSMSQSGFSQGSYGMSHSQHGGGGQGIGRAGGRVERTLSIESTDSSRSFVAEMKRRYAAEKDSRNSQPHPQGNNYRRVSSPPIPIPSNHGGRVADLASRYTATPPLDQSYPSSTTSSRHMMPTHQSRHSTSVLPPPGSLGPRSSPRPSDSYSRDRDERRLNYPEENEYVDRNRRYSNSNLQQQRNLESLVVEEQERERYGGGGGGSGSRPGSRPPSAQDRHHPPNCGCFRCMKEYGVSGSPRGSPGMGPSAGGDLREFGTLDGGRERPEERYYGDERYGSNMSSSGGGHRRE